MFSQRTLDRFLILVAPIALFVYASTRPIARLRADMPSQFPDVPASATRKERAEEERRAQAYWNCALTFIQWRYTYGSPLPDDPPEEFRVGAQAATPTEGPIGADTAANHHKERSQDQLGAARIRYWRRLRQVWLTPDGWKTSREWSTQWLTGPVAEGVKWIENYFSDLTRNGR